MAGMHLQCYHCGQLFPAPFVQRRNVMTVFGFVGQQGAGGFTRVDLCPACAAAIDGRRRFWIITCIVIFLLAVAILTLVLLIVRANRNLPAPLPDFPAGKELPFFPGVEPDKEGFKG